MKLFQINESNLNFQSNIFYTLGGIIKEETTLPKVNPKKYLRTWCFYLVHRDLYCLAYFLPISQKFIRGKLSYKERNSSNCKFSS